MAVTPQDLLAPVGELEADLFPGEAEDQETGSAKLVARLTAYIADAVAQGATTDAGVKAWAYHRAYKAVYIAMSANPIQASEEGQGSSAYSVVQADRFKDLADEWLDRFNGEVSVVPPSRQATPGTQTQSVGFTW